MNDEPSATDHDDVQPTIIGEGGLHFALTSNLEEASLNKGYDSSKLSQHRLKTVDGSTFYLWFNGKHVYVKTDSIASTQGENLIIAAVNDIARAVLSTPKKAA